ncbi:LRR receptor-like serine/threonine-protein kinase [Actinidia chinensis var. chinensis]|uniref:non-specific serine/threonine protein kinase n=1 Tax=Actinidia chinensis var. chinensis TaxID=1590841 RepID=A0A2R6RBH0_ACTCC|nr:LRR receptor-like serine/threonine-protein kinase [Actinidia chinensis var. chinensis]
MTKSVQSQVLDIETECQLIFAGTRIVRSEYLRATGYFSLSPGTSEACWDSLQVVVNNRYEGFQVRSNCGIQTSWISNSCLDINTKQEFEALIPGDELERVSSLCDQTLGNSSTCESCRATLSYMQKAYFHGQDANFSDCLGYPYMYAAAFVNRFGPTDLETTKCLFALDLISLAKHDKKHVFAATDTMIGCAIGFFGAISVVCFLWRWHKNKRQKKKSLVGLGSLGERTTLVKFTLGQMKAASMNFSRKNLIGKGGYGNVFRGVLANGYQVALKRFKNCAVFGDESFKHEVEVIASVKHVNLVGLRGYCMETDPLVGHQRIIVCDLMQNGSLYDHLFGLGETNKLSWPIRRKIALGTARGLAYLHNGAQPAIMHRDVKSSNILLDETFEPKLADFGLAKFTPDGFSHLSTKFVGTLGYVAPEYALYGQLTERSDVYSFGIVLLEILSGKQAVLAVENGKHLLLTDWAWSLVQKGQPLDVIEEGMPEMAPPEVMEKFVFVAVLCAHPMLHARPTMEQIVNILETGFMAVISIPDHPVSLIENANNIERSLIRIDLGSISCVNQRLSISGSGHSRLDHLEEEESSLALEM